MKNKILMCLMVCIIITLIPGCNQADRVSANLSQEADNFNIVRQLTVINCIANDVIFQMEGKISIKSDNVDHQLEVTVEDEEGNYAKHFIGLSDNVTYVVEQKRYKNTEKYKYILNFNPKMWLPVTVKTVN